MGLFKALAPEKFDAYKAAHLLWRAGFGGTWEECEALAALGLEGAVESLVNYSAPAEEDPPECATPGQSAAQMKEMVKGMSQAERQKTAQQGREAERRKIGDLKFWWLNRMLTTSRPLEEKMTLFWHSHFASSFIDKIEESFPMWKQNAMFRRNALAPFPQILKDVIRDPAMLIWLDNARSRKGRPNENFARELMELFSTGTGPYTEDDVKAGARSLTGFGIDREKWEFRFDQNAHDEGEKTYFGQKGNWSGDDVVRILCEQDATAKFMTRKFLEYFVCGNPAEPEVEEAAAFYKSNNLRLKTFLTALFTSEFFYSEKAMNSIVKSPVVLTVGALKSMRVPVPAQNVLVDALRLMGQDLFFPPDVNGWPGGMAWINSNMLLIRYNFANFLLNGVSPDKFKMFNRKTAGSAFRRREFVEKQRDSDAVNWSPVAQLRDLGVSGSLLTARDAVSYYVKEFLARPVPRELESQLMQFAETDAAGGHKSFNLQDPNSDERVRGLVHLIMSSPDYQLC